MVKYKYTKHKESRKALKTGLIMEGGAMRGMFTAGVMDVFMENGISFDGAIGVSAGAVFGCNYKSRQIGRVIRYNKRYCNDKRFVSLRSLIFTGDLYGARFGYHEIPEKLDKFDVKAFKENPMEFYVVCTDAVTGEAVYRKCESGEGEDIEWMRASASMPLASRIVNIGGRALSDGGTADSVPVRYFESIGYDRNVVILTQPRGYIKKKTKLLGVMRLTLGKYKGLIEAVRTRPERYNESIAYIDKCEREGKLLVIRPSEPLGIGHIEHDPGELERVYRIGRGQGLARLEEVKDFLRR